MRTLWVLISTLNAQRFTLNAQRFTLNALRSSLLSVRENLLHNVALRIGPYGDHGAVA